jgi:Ca-activated chloride channel family protein
MTMSDILSQWYWREPLWLLLALYPLVLLFWRKAKHRVSLHRYADPHLHPWVAAPRETHDHGLQRPTLSSFLIWSLIATAASGPRLLQHAPVELLPPQASAFVIIDHSRSMQARDIYPNRLQYAHSLLRQWILNMDNRRIGIIVFAGASHVVLPPTADKTNLTRISQVLGDIQLPTHGSAIQSAMQHAYAELSSLDGQKAIILMTDGDFSDDVWESLGSEISKHKTADISLHVLGIGSPSPVPLNDESGQWLLHDNVAVTTRLKEEKLKTLVQARGHSYQRMTDAGQLSLSDVWRPDASRINQAISDRVIWHELFPWFLLPAIILLVFDKIRFIPSYRVMTSGSLMTLGVLMLQLVPQDSLASGESSLQEAHRAWAKQDYARSTSLYARLHGYEARMGEGASCFRENNIECAISAFSEAAWQAKTDQHRGRAAYNLANTFFLQGNFPAAITLYRDALRYQPDTEDYRNNLVFTEEVQQQIELRLAQEAASRELRKQRGLRAMDIDQDIEITPDMSVTLEQNEDEAALLPIDDALLSEYIQRSKAYAGLKNSKGSSFKHQHDWSRFTNDDPAAAARMEFWQKLFEFEEGILVSPSEPIALPGVLPW